MKRFFKLDLDYNSRNHFRGIANYYEDLLYEKNIFIVDYFDKSTTAICSYNILNIYPIRHVTLGSFVMDLLYSKDLNQDSINFALDALKSNDENTAKLGFDMIIKSQYLYDYNFLHAFVNLFFDFYGYRYNVNTPYLFLDLHREFILEALKSHLVYIKRRYIK